MSAELRPANAGPTRKPYGLALGLLMSVALVSQQAAAEMQPSCSECLELKAGLAFTFDFDSCDEQTLGAEWRQALRGLADECKFSSEYRAEYLNTIDRSETEYERLLKHNGDPPHFYLRDPQSCKDLLASPPATALRERLALYKQGKLSATEALQQTCKAPEAPHSH